MPMASAQEDKKEVVCFGSTKSKNQDAKANKDEGKSAQEDGRKSARALQEREMKGPVKVTLNDPAVVVVGTILGPNLGEERRIIYYDD